MSMCIHDYIMVTGSYGYTYTGSYGYTRVGQYYLGKYIITIVTFVLPFLNEVTMLAIINLMTSELTIANTVGLLGSSLINHYHGNP